MTEIFANLGLLLIVLAIISPIIIFIMFLVLCSNVGRIRKVLQQILNESKQ